MDTCMKGHRIRWSDNDQHFGPFIYSKSKYKNIALVLGSGDDEESAGCRLRISVYRHTFILELPAIIKPWKRKVVAESWDESTIARLGRNWYYDCHEREYGFSYSEGFLNVLLGRQTGDSSTEQRKGYFLPWTQWKHVRHSYYGLDGRLYWTEPQVLWRGMTVQQNIDTHRSISESRDACPIRTFSFADFDGEQLTAKTRIEEREWHLGTGWFSWLRFFRKPKICRSLDIAFSGETGERKGSWKGGTVGHSIEMTTGELHESAFRRYCDEHKMKFIETT